MSHSDDTYMPEYFNNCKFYMCSIITDLGTYVLRPFCPQIMQQVPISALKNTVHILANSSMNQSGLWKFEECILSDNSGFLYSCE
jgi:hypothetical protein